MIPHGLRQQIALASSDSEIASLLAIGKGYVLASNTTRRSWISTADRRRAALSGTKLAPKPVVEDEVEVAPKAKKKSKRAVA